MSTIASLPIRTKILLGAFLIYASLVLVSMATMSIGAILLILAFIISTDGIEGLKNEVAAEWERPFSRIYILLSILLVLACLASIANGILNPLTYEGRSVHRGFFPDMAKTWYLFWPFILVIILRRLNSQGRKIAFHTWIATFGILSLLGIFQYYIGWPRNQSIPAEPGRYHATLFLGHHLSTASIFIFPFFACLDSLARLISIREFQSRRFFIYLAASLFGVATLFLTYSRTLWFALPFGILVWGVWSLPQVWPKNWTKRTKFIPALIFVLAMGAISQYPPVQRRIFNLGGVSERRDLWQANIEFFKARPLLGVGWRRNQELSGYNLMAKYHTNDVFSGHAHNNFLEMLGGLGIIGATIWLLWNFWVISIPIRNPLLYSKGIVCAWIVFHLNGLTQVNFWEAKVQHQIAWIIAWSLL